MDQLISIVNDPDVIVTVSGVHFNFVNPTVDMVRLDDIAYALSRIKRWGAHHPGQITVAQHSVHVSEILRIQGYSASVQLQGLMHDASEAYIGDICRPVKAKMPIFYEMEERIMHVVAKALYFEWPMLDEVKRADDLALRMEWNSWQLGESYLGSNMTDHYAAFRERYNMLAGQSIVLNDDLPF